MNPQKVFVAIPCEERLPEETGSYYTDCRRVFIGLNLTLQNNNKMRTDEEIKRQIEGLKAMKKWLPSHSAFGDANHDGIDAQLDILEFKSVISDFDEYDESQHSFDEDSLDYVRQQAEAADEWLCSESDEDLFEEER